MIYINVSRLTCTVCRYAHLQHRNVYKTKTTIQSSASAHVKVPWGRTALSSLCVASRLEEAIGKEETQIELIQSSRGHELVAFPTDMVSDWPHGEC